MATLADLCERDRAPQHKGELVRVSTGADPNPEITEITYRMVTQKRAGTPRCARELTGAGW